MSKYNVASKIYPQDEPVVVCDERLYVVDVNEAARELFGEKVFSLCLEKYLNPDDRASVRSLVFFAKYKKSSRTVHLVVNILPLKRHKTAVFVLREYFNKHFLEVHLFKSREALMQSGKGKRLLAPTGTFLPQYKTAMLRDYADENAEKLNRVFGCNMLKNLDAQAKLNEYDPAESFELIELSKRLTVDISKRLDAVDCAFRFTPIGSERHVSPCMSIENFINLYTLLLRLTSALSRDKLVEVKVGSGRWKTSALFSLDAIEGDVIFSGELAFGILGEIYPKYSATVYMINYLSERFGVGCYADIDSSRHLTIELDLTDRYEEFDTSPGVPEKYFSYIDRAIENSNELL